MNLLKTKLGRTSAVIAGSIIGLAGVAVFASPASAHAPIVKGDTSCIPDGAKTWDVTWHIGNDYNVNDVTAVVQSVKLYKPVADSSSLSKSRGGNNGGGNNGHSGGGNNGHNGGGNNNGGGNGGDDNGLGTALSATEATITGAADGTPVAFGDNTLTAKTEVKDTDLTGVRIAVILRWSDGYINDGKNGHGDPVTATVDKPDYCTPESTPPTKPTQPVTPPETAPAVPAPTASFDCTTETINFDNSKGSVSVSLELKTTKGEVRTVKVGAGEKAKPEIFSGKTGFSVHATTKWTDKSGEAKSDFADFDYKAPAGCDTSGQGGGLPVTGAAAGGIAGGAAVLLAAGGVLFVMARRRKVKFTA